MVEVRVVVVFGGGCGFELVGRALLEAGLLELGI